MTPDASNSDAALPGLRRQYHFRPGPRGLRAWDVHRLIRLTRGLPVIDVPLAALRELDQPYWFSPEDDAPTPRAIVAHVQLMDGCDLRWPIILCADGGVMDGMHRAAQALRLGHTHIRAVRFGETPPPDFEGMAPADQPPAARAPSV